jgi:hypothetical protein
MNTKILRDTKNDMLVGRQVSNMMLQNYTRGFLAIANAEQATDDGIADSVTTINPTKVIRMRKQKNVPLTGPELSQGYKVKAVKVTKKAENASSQQAKDFLMQSKALDNELDHVLAQMKYNNKEEFYDNAQNTDTTGDTYKTLRDELKSQIVSKPELADLIKQYDDLTKEIHDQKREHNKILQQTGDEDEKLLEEIEYNEQLHQALGARIKEVKAKEFKEYIPEKKEVVKKLIENGKTVDIERSDGKGATHKFKDMNDRTLESTITGTNDHRKSKKNIRIISTTGVDKLSQDLLLEIKKISNFITVTLMPLAQKLHNDRFQGTDLQDLKYTIPELYKEMDEKMYILTSLNNVSNTQLTKLDKDFDKLYNLVNNGLSSFVMATGGSIPMTVDPSTSKYNHVRHTTNYLWEL